MSELYESLKPAMERVGRDKLIVNLENAIDALLNAGYKIETESLFYRKDLTDYQIDNITIENPDGTFDIIAVCDMTKRVKKVVEEWYF